MFRGEPRPISRLSRWHRLGAAALFVLFATACRPPQKMADQPQHDPYEPSVFFEDGMSSRQQVPGTVARGTLHEDEFLHTGRVGGQLVSTLPFPIGKEELDRGRERYDIYCSMCHGMTGAGNGMVVQRGFRKAASFHTDALRNQRVGHFFDVMTNGFGSMPAYASMIPAEDRWMIAAYIRALQLSQSATLADVPDAERKVLEGETSR